ncbi:hypothetical protein DVH05_007615 [Phytophthora capsici]|nr:hypothetical protein DVH05_007615 [Phytophthora capsici]
MIVIELDSLNSYRLKYCNGIQRHGTGDTGTVAAVDSERSALITEGPLWSSCRTAQDRHDRQDLDSDERAESSLDNLPSRREADSGLRNRTRTPADGLALDEQRTDSGRTDERWSTGAWTQRWTSTGTSWTDERRTERAGDNGLRVLGGCVEEGDVHVVPSPSGGQVTTRSGRQRNGRNGLVDGRTVALCD